MVSLKAVKEANAGLVRKQPLVAAFFGGTSGIGEYTLRALVATCRIEGKAPRVYIVGRNAKAAQDIIADCEKDCPDGKFCFVKAEDLSLLKDVDAVCSRISQLEQAEVGKDEQAKLDILVMSQACTIFQQQQDTSEGLDFLMSLMYYSRMRAVVNLLPLLTASALPGRVISVYAAGTEAKVFPEDLSLRQPGRYGYFQARSHTVYMKTLFMEALAKNNMGRISLVHVFPGLVMTPAFRDPQIPSWFRILWRIIGGFLAKFWAVPAEECGARILYLATSRYPPRQEIKDGMAVTEQPNNDVTVRSTDGVVSGGAYSVNWNDEIIKPNKAWNTVNRVELGRLVEDHTNKVFDDIHSQGVFKS